MQSAGLAPASKAWLDTRLSTEIFGVGPTSSVGDTHQRIERTWQSPEMQGRMLSSRLLHDQPPRDEGKLPVASMVPQLSQGFGL